MKNLTTLITGFIGLLFLSAIGYFLFEISNLIITNFDKININVFITVIGGTVTISSFFITRYLEKKKVIENEIRNKKIPIYEEFFAFYFKVVYNSISENDMITFFKEFNQKAIIWFPDETLKSYVEWRKKVMEFAKDNTNDNLINLIFHQEDFLKQFRKDIGHSNKYLVKGDISSLYINDIDKYI
jgi:hypothetical protein